MTKLDFAIHLFTQARSITSGQSTRVPIVSVLILLLLAKRPEEWITGSTLAEEIPTLSSSIIGSSTRAAVDAGYLARRPYQGGVNGALEWRITNSGLRLVQQLIATPTTTPA